MSTRQHLRYWIDVAGLALPAREVKGHERLSTPSHFVARMVAEEAFTLDPDELLKQYAAVRLEREGTERIIDGIVTEASLSATIRGVPELILVIEPRLAIARHRTDIRLFRDQTVPEIVTQVLAGLGIAPELRLSDSYERRPYCVQLRETDLAFVSRLLEDEGIFYFFLEGDVMVLGDSPAAYEPIQGNPVLPFHHVLGTSEPEDAVRRIGRRAAFSPGKVTLRDFNPDHPSLDMTVTAPAPTRGGPDFYDYPGEYLEPDVGARRAKKMSEALACEADLLTGTTSSARFVPGRTFTLEGSPGDTDGELVITSVEHAFHLERGGFSLGFGALAEAVPFRPPRVTPAPVLPNPLTGFVTGPDSEDIHTDEFGRVKVHFHWDRGFPRDDTCSDWIPTLQDNTGHSSAIPRIGWEVLVHFLEGDPDRPVVLGRVYNAEDSFPAKLPEEKTHSALKSLSSPTRDGTNEIRLDDLAGSERVITHAERDQNVVVANDKRENVFADERDEIGRDHAVSIGNDHRATVGNNLTSTVKGDATWLVTSDRRRKISGNEGATVVGDRSLTVGGMHFRRISTEDSVKAKQVREQVGGVILEAFLKTNNTEASKAMTLIVGGAFVEVAKDNKDESAGLGRLETVGGVVFSKAGGTMKAGITKSRTTNVGAMLKIASKEKLLIEGTEKVKGKAGMGSLDGARSITLKVGDSMVLMTEGLIQIGASGTVSMKATAKHEEGADESDQN